MRVLVACEFSGIVRTAFERKGWEAWSCDLIASEQSGNHYQGDALELLEQNWDLLIAHPPCQFLSYAGNRYFNVDKYGQQAIDRINQRSKALEFFLKFWEAPVPYICIENPRGYPMRYLKPTQYLHPYYFGDEDKKLTCLWLKGLPPLLHSKTDTLFESRTHSDQPAPVYVDKSGKPRYKTEAIDGSSKDGAKERARFYPKVAEAMSEQWTTFIKNQSIVNK